MVNLTRRHYEILKDAVDFAILNYSIEDFEVAKELREILDRILARSMLLCPVCKKLGGGTPVHGDWYHNVCWIEHTKTCRACAVSLAMEK